LESQKSHSGRPSKDSTSLTDCRKRDGDTGLQGPLWVRLTATFFGAGLINPGPGSWAAGATVLLCWLAGHWIPPAWQLVAVSFAAALAILVGIPAASWMARTYRLKDLDFVVIDEVAGQLVSLVGVPLTGACVLTAFVLF
jgi:phosphatidylglycerophosphatase A